MVWKILRVTAAPAFMMKGWRAAGTIGALRQRAAHAAPGTTQAVRVALVAEDKPVAVRDR